MMPVRLFLRVFVCLCLVMGTWPVNAQELRDLLKTQQQQIDDLKAETGLLKDMLASIIAGQAADRATHTYAANPAAAREEFEAIKGNVDHAIKRVDAIPDNGLPEGLKASVKTCLEQIKATRDGIDTTTPEAILAACDVEQAKKIAQELREARDDAVKTWKACRETIDGIKAIGPVDLTFDPSGMSPDSIKRAKAEIERLKGIADDKKGAAKECIGGLEDTFNKIQNAETAADALGEALSVAASICFATGANPIACGAIFAIALLLDLFDGKGGGGGGEGEGEGEGRGKGKGPENGGGIPGKSSGKDTGKNGDCEGVGCGDPVVPDPPVACPGGGKCPIGVPEGEVLCGITSATAIACNPTGKNEPLVTIDAAAAILLDTEAQKEFTQTIGSEDLRGTFFCVVDGPNFIEGIVLKSAADPAKSYLIRVDYGDGVKLGYPPSTVASPSEADLNSGKACVFN